MKATSDLKSFKQERYDHFPFTQGESLEKHRASLGQQLKDDLKSYLS
jgi:hypothetical protein